MIGVYNILFCLNPKIELTLQLLKQAAVTLVMNHKHKLLYSYIHSKHLHILHF